jgi:2-amino-4-hydroxy-6-hydroxymethyldihydropteridine diphosphokinase
VVTHAAIAIGSNLGDRAQVARSAIGAIAALPLTSVTAVSSFVETTPVGPIAQPAYLNACVRVATCLTPRGLLTRLLEIERAHGRNRAMEQRWGPRTLDLDILLFGEVSMRDEANEPHLILPHPRLHERLFALEPLAQVWPEAMIEGEPIARCIERLRRQGA